MDLYTPYAYMNILGELRAPQSYKGLQLRHDGGPKLEQGFPNKGAATYRWNQLQKEYPSANGWRNVSKAATVTKSEDSGKWQIEYHFARYG